MTTRWQTLPSCGYGVHVATMNVSLPGELKEFADEQASGGRYGSASEYVRELIRRDQDRARLRGALLAGAASPVAVRADDAYFDRLRRRLSSEAARPDAARPETAEASGR